jgi:hypothetical protein
MQVAREWPQLEEGKRQRAADLSYREAVKLLAAPQTEEFTSLQRAEAITELVEESFDLERRWWAWKERGAGRAETPAAMAGIAEEVLALQKRVADLVGPDAEPMGRAAYLDLGNGWVLEPGFHVHGFFQHQGQDMRIFLFPYAPDPRFVHVTVLCSDQGSSDTGYGSIEGPKRPLWLGAVRYFLEALYLPVERIGWGRSERHKGMDYNTLLFTSKEQYINVAILGKGWGA